MSAIPQSDAIIGQAAGDVLGLLLHHLPYKHFIDCLHKQRLPIAGQDYPCTSPQAPLPGIYTTHTQITLALYRCWEDLKAPENCKSFEQELRYLWPQLHPPDAPTLFRGPVPSLKPIYGDQPAPKRSDIYPALWLGPLCARHKNLVEPESRQERK